MSNPSATHDRNQPRPHESGTDDERAEAVRPRRPAAPVDVITRQLVENLGSAVVAALAGARTSKGPHSWGAGEVRPSDDVEDRLRAAAEIWELLVEAEGADNARAWFVGANPILEKPPALALRSGDIEGARAAARAFAEGVWHL